jgi:hypothetical protein
MSVGGAASARALRRHQRCDLRLIVLVATPKRREASAWLRPASMARSSRSRRSTEYCFIATVSRRPNSSATRFNDAKRMTVAPLAVRLGTSEAVVAGAARADDVHPTELGSYEEVWAHIEGHRVWLEEEFARRQAGVKEAVRRWYDHIYTPIFALARQHNVFRLFPRRTETDLYLRLLRRRDKLYARYRRT